MTVFFNPFFYYFFFLKRHERIRSIAHLAGKTSRPAIFPLSEVSLVGKQQGKSHLPAAADLDDQPNRTRFRTLLHHLCCIMLLLDAPVHSLLSSVTLGCGDAC